MEGECSISLVEEEAPFHYNINNQGHCVVAVVDFKIYDNEDRSSTLSYAVPCMHCDNDAADALSEVLSDLVEDFELPENMFSDIYEALESGYMIPAANNINCVFLAADRSAPRVSVHIRGGGEANRRPEAFLHPCLGGFVCSICLEEAPITSEAPDAQSESEVCVKTPCDHQFHKACLSRWLGRHQTCPYCRSRILVM